MINKHTKQIAHERGDHLHLDKATPEPAVCKECGAIYVDRRWTISDVDPTSIKHQRWGKPQIVTCPACKQKEEGIISGYVYIDGTFFEAHNEEIERMLKNEAERAAENNPLARIMNWERGNGHLLTISTTTEHLAQRLGHALEKAFCGEVKYNFSDENKLARVWWHRDQ
jgi:hypothetical protein